MKNRTVVVRMLSSDQISSVTEHAKNLGALGSVYIQLTG